MNDGILISDLIARIDLTNDEAFLDFQAWKKFGGDLDTLKVIIEKYNF